VDQPINRTRQIRLSDPDTIRKRVKDFVGKKINIVLADNRVVVGEVTDVQQAGITLRNMRLKLMDFPFIQITEIYLDIPA
jgi:hypothetical protein